MISLSPEFLLYPQILTESTLQHKLFESSNDQTFSTFTIEWFLLVAYVDIERSIVCSLVFSLQGRKKIPDNSFNDF